MTAAAWRMILKNWKARQGAEIPASQRRTIRGQKAWIYQQQGHKRRVTVKYREAKNEKNIYIYEWLRGWPVLWFPIACFLGL